MPPSDVVVNFRSRKMLRPGTDGVTVACMTTTTTTTPVRIRTFKDATAVLAETLPGYESRPEQELLATAIESVWTETPTSKTRVLVGQAGTGTGKSLASLIPSILSRKRTIYSTGTKALQSQLMEKDLPFLAEHLGVDFKFAMLQGIGNYFCQARAVEKLDDPLSKRAWDEFEADTDMEMNGLRSSLSFEIDERTWSYLTTSADDCTRKKCPFYAECRFMKARTEGLAADVLVVNHALVALNARLKQDTGIGFVLGEYDHMILDEAHEFEEFVTMALTEKMTQGTFVSLNNDLLAFSRKHENDEIPQLSIGLVPSAQQFFRTFEEGRIRHQEAIDKSDVVIQMMTPLGEILEMLDKFTDTDFDSAKDLSNWNRLRSRTRNLLQALGDFLLKSDVEAVRMIELESGRKYPEVLSVVPVNVGPWLKQWLWSEVKPVLVSATILVGGKADFIVNRLGLQDEEVVVVDVGTPFDYDTNSQLYIPRHIPAPAGSTREQWESEMLPLMEELIKASRGRALLLFTSTSQMRKAYDVLAPGLPYETKKQGDLPNDAMTRWFRETTDSVLFATRSFFTGIDVQGEALSLVVIDKLPFPVPTEPVFEARCEEVEMNGGKPFFDLSVPVMTLTLQQAFGRLIRTKQDRGVVAILDPRLSTKGYGHTICKSLPAPQVFDLNDVDRFFEEG